MGAPAPAAAGMGVGERRGQPLRAALFLCHTTGDAIAFALLWLTGYRQIHPSGAWWAERPIWLVVPLVCTIPVILLFGRRWTRRPTPHPAV